MNKYIATALLLSIVVVPLVYVQRVQAAVAFNTFPISFTPKPNHDLPLIDARNVTKGGSYSVSQTDHDNGVMASPGDEIEFQIYYHNSGTNEDVATNVFIRAVLPGGKRTAHEVEGRITSDQTSMISSSDAFRGGNITVHIDGEPQTLELIPGTVRHIPNAGTTGSFPLPDSLVTSGVNIGSIKGCFEFSGFIVFRAKVGHDTPPPVETYDLSIQKRVLNLTRGESVFQDSTQARPEDRVRFEIKVAIIGSSSHPIYQNNVILRDILPARLTLESGSIRVDGAVSNISSDLFASGYNFGTLATGIQKTIVFDARVASAGVFSESTTLINTANVRSDQVSTKQDEARVVVQLVEGVSFQQRKTAFNLTQGVDATKTLANPGDEIIYTLYFKNTGQTTIREVRIEDDIRDILELSEVVDMGGAESVNNVIRFAPVDVLSDIEISRVFRVKVKSANLFPASSDLVMVNIYGNEVRVRVRKPSDIVPPRTGPGEWALVLLAGGATFGFWFYRRRQLA